MTVHGATLFSTPDGSAFEPLDTTPAHPGLRT